MTLPAAVLVETRGAGGDDSGVVCAGAETAGAEALKTETGAETGGAEMVGAAEGVFATGGA